MVKGDWFIFISTAWGRNNGGINTVNYALIKNLRQVIVSDWKVYCILTQEKADSDFIEDVERELGVTLIYTKTPVTSTNLKKVLSEKHFERLFFIGHDIITGEYANQLRDKTRNAMSIIFHHMNYSSYYYLRESDPAKIREKESLQKRIIPNADIVVPIGPLLESSARDLCIDARRDNKAVIHELTPGLDIITPIDKIHENHTVILFGRIENKNNCVKQIDLAIDALATYVKKNQNRKANLIIKCFGYADDSQVNQKKLQEEVCLVANQTIPITANSYIADEDELHDILATASLCIMPSVYEGFGLVGYEAIAAGVPVIISQNTGLFKFLESWNGTNIRGLYESVFIKANSSSEEKTYTQTDLEELVKCIDSIFSDYEKYKKNALLLRKTLLDGHCTWNYAAKAFVGIINEQIKNNGSKLRSIRVKVDRKNNIGMKEYINSFLIAEFCGSFCNCNEVVVKIIKYSNDRNRRFTIFSSTAEDSIMRVRMINDGTVGILNDIFSQGKVAFPVVISNFAYSKCYLIAENSYFEQIETGNMGVPDHHVLVIIAAPLLYNNELVGALTFDIYSEKFAKQLVEDSFEVMKDIIYNSISQFAKLLSYQFYNEIKDDLNFCEVNRMITERELVSFSGKCPLNCKHCFAKEIVSDDEVENEVEDVLEQLAGKNFDVVYVSHYKENFFNPEKGINLCEEIYEKYQCDICVTTRCIFTAGLLRRIEKLYKVMKETSNKLTFCISVSAYDSYSRIEDEGLIPTPQQRIDFANQLRKIGITRIVTVRPLFPSSYISTDEVHMIIDKCKGKVDAILTGGIYVNDRILADVGMESGTFTYLENVESDYLVGVEKSFKAVNVENELNDLEDYCKMQQIPFFRHSMDALNYFSI